jgi:transcriptional regulator with XRE-family HTH domain
MQTGVGKKIYEARKALKMSQLALARATGSSRPTVSNWENGRFAPELASLNKLSAALKKPVAYFLENNPLAQVAEPPAAYGVSGNSVRLPLLNQVPADLSGLHEEHIEGYIEIPRFISKGARYGVIAPDKSGDYYLVRPETQAMPGKTMLIVSVKGYSIARIQPNKQLPQGFRIAGQIVKIIKNLV